MVKQPLKEAGKDKATVVIDAGLCKGCQICIAFCPKNVFELDDNEKAVVRYQDRCNACGLCELRCPDLAIEVKTS